MYINPVMFTDPTGNIAIADDLVVWGIIFIIAIIASVAIKPAVVEIAEAIETAHSARNKDNYYVYTLLDEHNNVFYVGITKNPKTRLRDHKNRFGQFIKMNYSSAMSESQARVLETGLILSHGLDNIIDVSPFSDKMLPYNLRKSVSNRRYPGSLILNKIDSELRLLWEKLGGR